MTAFYAGFSLGLSLIIAIGAQNAFVLKQGLHNQHVFIVCLLCALSDSVLILIGVSGYYWMVGEFRWLVPTARYAGSAFLLAFGARSFYAAARSSAQQKVADHANHSVRCVVSTCLALTWLNPHVYLDTVLLLGSISTQYPGGKIYFASGAMLSSFVFFFALGYGARILIPVFTQRLSWRILDALIGVVMWSIAASLLLG